MTTIQFDITTTANFQNALRCKIIREQNDAFRKMGLQDESVGRWVLTKAINDEGPVFVAACIAAVRAYEDFSEDIDPNGDHSMGSFVVDGRTVWFKVDLYDASYEYGSSDPTDVTATRRVLTVLFPSDY